MMSQHTKKGIETNVSRLFTVFWLHNLSKCILETKKCSIPISNNSVGVFESISFVLQCVQGSCSANHIRNIDLQHMRKWHNYKTTLMKLSESKC